jgi:hypothetical protein
VRWGSTAPEKGCRGMAADWRGRRNGEAARLTGLERSLGLTASVEEAQNKPINFPQATSPYSCLPPCLGKSRRRPPASPWPTTEQPPARSSPLLLRLSSPRRRAARPSVQQPSPTRHTTGNQSLRLDPCSCSNWYIHGSTTYS